MEINEINQKIQEYTTNLTNLQNEKTKIDQDLAIINNQIETNKNELIKQFGTDNEQEISIKMQEIEQEIIKLENDYTDVINGKVSTDIIVPEIQTAAINDNQIIDQNQTQTQTHQTQTNTYQSPPVQPTTLAPQSVQVQQAPIQQAQDLQYQSTQYQPV